MCVRVSDGRRASAEKKPKRAFAGFKIQTFFLSFSSFRFFARTTFRKILSRPSGGGEKQISSCILSFSDVQSLRFLFSYSSFLFLFYASVLEVAATGSQINIYVFFIGIYRTVDRTFFFGDRDCPR